MIYRTILASTILSPRALAYLVVYISHIHDVVNIVSKVIHQDATNDVLGYIIPGIRLSSYIVRQDSYPLTWRVQDGMSHIPLAHSCTI